MLARNFLQLNEDKTVVLIFYSSHLTAVVTQKLKSKNLHVLFDTNFTFNWHVNSVDFSREPFQKWGTSYHPLKNLVFLSFSYPEGVSVHSCHPVLGITTTSNEVLLWPPSLSFNKSKTLRPVMNKIKEAGEHITAICVSLRSLFILGHTKEFLCLFTYPSMVFPLHFIS